MFTLALMLYVQKGTAVGQRVDEALAAGADADRTLPAQDAKVTLSAIHGHLETVSPAELDNARASLLGVQIRLHAAAADLRRHEQELPKPLAGGDATWPVRAVWSAWDHLIEDASGVAYDAADKFDSAAGFFARIDRCLRAAEQATVRNQAAGYSRSCLLARQARLTWAPNAVANDSLTKLGQDVRLILEQANSYPDARLFFREFRRRTHTSTLAPLPAPAPRQPSRTLFRFL